MKTTLINRLAWISSLLLAALIADHASAQSRIAPYLGISDKAGASDDSGQTSAIVLSGPNLRVSKTAFVDGHEVCGVIRITNSGGQTATISAIADSLEVHFPRGITPPPLPAGSTSNWFKVADVPIALPSPIAPGATISIDYCYSLCLTADYAGANSMRNVVTVTASTSSGASRSFTTRSTSFPPPVLDCQACCLPDGDCTDTVPDDCAAEGGFSKGTGSDCNTTECTQACCGTFLDDNSNTIYCVDIPPELCDNDNVSQGPGSSCASIGPVPNACTQACCEPDGTCLDISARECGFSTHNGIPRGEGTDCATAECTQACCGTFLDDNSNTIYCVDIPPELCDNGNISQGPGSSCASIGPVPNACTQACCEPDGTCLDISARECGFSTHNGIPRGEGTDCATAECSVACCGAFVDFPDSCADIRPDLCDGHLVSLGPGSSCAAVGPAPNACTQACCLPDGSCIDVSVVECGFSSNEGIAQGPGSSCASIGSCTVACCGAFFDTPDSCADLRPDRCAGALFSLGSGTSCAAVGPAPNACTQACCLPDGSCIDVSVVECGFSSNEGTPQGAGTDCSLPLIQCEGINDP